MLDPGENPAGRDAVANEAKGKIEAEGTLKHENIWGLRKLAYEINQRNEADYRWFRFEAQPPLLEQLDHSLKIADGVLRFRIFKVDADTPVMIPPSTAAPAPGASRERSDDEDAAAPAAEEGVGEAAREPVAEVAEPETAPEPAAETEAAEPAPADGEGESAA